MSVVKTAAAWLCAGCLALASAPALGQEAGGGLGTRLDKMAGNIAGKLSAEAKKKGERLRVGFRPAWFRVLGGPTYCEPLSADLRNALHERVEAWGRNQSHDYDVVTTDRGKQSPPEVTATWSWDGKRVRVEAQLVLEGGVIRRVPAARLAAAVFDAGQRKCLFSSQAEDRTFQARARGHLHEELTFRPDARVDEYRAGKELSLLGRIDPAEPSGVSWWVVAWKDPVTGEERNLFARGLDLSGPPVVQDADPHAVRRAVLKLGLERARAARDHARVLSYLDELAALGGAQPRAADYYRGEALYAVERYGAAREALERYARVAADGPRYDRTLNLLLELREREKAAQRAREEAERMEAERRAREAREKAERREAARWAREAQKAEVDLGLDRAKRMAVQRGLAALGHGAGVADGVLGRPTRAALRDWQAGRGLEATGYLTREQAETLIAVARKEAARRAREAREEAARRAREAAARRAEVGLGLDRAKRTAVQRGLAALGHGAGVADGVLGPRARAALRDWQAGRGLEATGYLTEKQAETLIAVAREVREKAEQRRRRTAGYRFRDCPECRRWWWCRPVRS